jgi:hypothetical protein
MGRPVASENNKQLGVAFAKAVSIVGCAGQRWWPTPTLSFCDSAGSWRYSVLTGSILVGCPGQVTVACDDSTQVVARSGHLSIFAALEECCPGCVRNESPTGRRGLTRIEFNKALERQDGFEKMRDRRADAATCEEDPTGGDATPCAAPGPTVVGGHGPHCARSHRRVRGT